MSHVHAIFSYQELRRYTTHRPGHCLLRTHSTDQDTNNVAGYNDRKLEPFMTGAQYKNSFLCSFCLKIIFSGFVLQSFISSKVDTAENPTVVCNTWGVALSQFARVKLKIRTQSIQAKTKTKTDMTIRVPE